MITFIVQGEFSYDPEMNPNPPLPGCRLETRTLTETVYGSCRTLEEARKHEYSSKWFMGSGTNHREVMDDGGLPMTAKEEQVEWEGWLLDVPGLSELARMIDCEHGLAIIKTKYAELPYELRTKGEVIL